MVLSVFGGLEDFRIVGGGERRRAEVMMYNVVECLRDPPPKVAAKSFNGSSSRQVLKSTVYDAGRTGFITHPRVHNLHLLPYPSKHTIHPESRPSILRYKITCPVVDGRLGLLPTLRLLTCRPGYELALLTLSLLALALLLPGNNPKCTEKYHIHR